MRCKREKREDSALGSRAGRARATTSAQPDFSGAPVIGLLYVWCAANDGGSLGSSYYLCKIAEDSRSCDEIIASGL